MKKVIKYFFAIILLAVVGGLVWWQYNKKRIVKNEITKAVSNGTDSTYFIKYDSSNIDAIAGNATFYNIVLQSDSLQQQLYTDDTTAIPRTILNVHIEKLAIVGANIPSFIQKNKIEANAIEITRPVITIIKTGKATPVQFTASDTLALYEKLTGKFKSIQAKSIRIIDGTIAFAKGKQSPYANLQGVNVGLNNLKIDSTRNYDNLISYFIKDVVATVKSANVLSYKTNRKFLVENIEYNAPKRYVSLQKVLQLDAASGKNLMLLTGNKISGLSTDLFIVKKTIKADSLTTAGGAVAVFKNSSPDKGSQSISIQNDFFDQAIVKNIFLGPTTVSVHKKSNATDVPLIIKNVRFNARNIDSIYSGTDILQLLNKSEWDAGADGVSFFSADNLYKISLGSLLADKIKRTFSIKTVTVKTVQPEKAVVSSLKTQKDIFDVNLKNITFSGTDFSAMLEKQMLTADVLSVEPVLKVFNDRTVPPDTSSKLGKYPHQLIMAMKMPIYIKQVLVKNGYISYRERGAISKEVGDVFFSKVTGSLENVTNIPALVKRNDVMTVNVHALFLNTASIDSKWIMPLDSRDGAFSITGKVGAFNGQKLNPVTEPLGMGSITSANINGYTFTLNGNDNGATGQALLLYNNLKIKLLKIKDDKSKNKAVISFLANVFIKDQNPSNGKTRTGTIGFERVMSKSFFNLVWKSIFDGAKKSIK